MQADITLVFDRFRPYVEAELKDIVGNFDSPFYNMFHYHLGWIDRNGKPISSGGGGKQLRPVLCLLTYEMFGGDFRDAVPAAAALELEHNFTLIHDDIQDKSVERRHRPTVWSIWGDAQAINAGDGMYALARLALLRLGKTFSHAKVLSVIETLDRACLSLCEGQFLDITFEKRPSVSVEEYLSMIGGKTAGLLSASCRVGALLGTDDLATIQAFAKFGEKLGFAFQIKDDLLGIWGKEDKTGKSIEGDIEQRKKTLPVIYALEHSSPTNKKRLVDLYGRPTLTISDMRDITDTIELSGARDFAEKLAHRFLSEALSELETVRIAHSAKWSLSSLAQFVLERDF